MFWFWRGAILFCFIFAVIFFYLYSPVEEDKVYELVVLRSRNLYKIVEQYQVTGRDESTIWRNLLISNSGEDVYSFSPSKFHF